MRIVVGNTGIFEVRLNGVAEITFSGDTYDSGDIGIRQMTLNAISNASSSATRFDDVLMWNSVAKDSEPVSWIGDIRIDTLRPSANGDTVNSTPLSGAAWAAVDDVGQDGDTTYTGAGTVGNKDLYQMTDLSETPTTIIGVAVSILSKTTGTTPRRLKAKVKRTTEADGAVRNVPLGSYGIQQEMFSRDPFTGVTWDAAGVNAMQVGWEVDT